MLCKIAILRIVAAVFQKSTQPWHTLKFDAYSNMTNQNLQAETDIIETEQCSNTPNVPYGSYFNIMIRTCLIPNKIKISPLPEQDNTKTEVTETKLIFQVKVDFVKKTLGKSLVEGPAKKGCIEYWSKMTEALESYLVKHVEMKDETPPLVGETFTSRGQNHAQTPNSRRPRIDSSRAPPVVPRRPSDLAINYSNVQANGPSQPNQIRRRHPTGALTRMTDSQGSNYNDSAYDSSHDILMTNDSLANQNNSASTQNSTLLSGTSSATTNNNRTTSRQNRSHRQPESSQNTHTQPSIQSNFQSNSSRVNQKVLNSTMIDNSDQRVEEDDGFGLTEIGNKIIDVVINFLNMLTMKHLVGFVIFLLFYNILAVSRRLGRIEEGLAKMIDERKYYKDDHENWRDCLLNTFLYQYD